MTSRALTSFAAVVGMVAALGCGSDNNGPSNRAEAGRDSAPVTPGPDASPVNEVGAADSPAPKDGPPLPPTLDAAPAPDAAPALPDVPVADALAEDLPGPDRATTLTPDVANPDVPPLKEVTGAVATPGNGVVSLAWVDPEQAGLTAIEISWSPGAGTPLLVTAGAQIASVSSLQNGTAYTFTLRTVDRAGNRSAGVSVNATPVATTLAEVAGLAARVSGRAVTLTWTNPSGAGIDHLQITYLPGGATPISVALPTQTKTFPTLDDGAVYTFLLQTVDASGHLSTGVTVQAVVDTSVPSIGEGISFSELQTTSVIVTWGEANDNLTPPALLQYTLLRAPAGADLTTLAAVAAHGTVVQEGAGLLSVAVDLLSEATTYQFAVMVQDALGNQSLYPPAQVTTLANSTPVPGAPISFFSIGSASVDIRWGAATDAVTAPAALEYKLVRAAATTDIDTIAEADAVTGAGLAMDWTAGSTAKLVAGLAQATQYYFAVLVRNAGGGKALYSPAGVLIPAPQGDTTPPRAGTDISFGAITGTSVVVNWGAATDDYAPRSQLRYKVVGAASSAAIDTVAKADAITGAAVVLDWTANTTTKTVTGLTSATTYWFAVLVEDVEGNKTLYAPASAETIDITPPVPGDSITFSNVVASSVKVIWGAAVDDVSAAEVLEYKLVQASAAEDIDTLEEADALVGAAVVMGWTANTIDHTVSGLNEATAYYFAVVVRDAAGNKALYAPALATTADATAPSAGTAIAFEGLTGTGVTVKWGGASDNKTGAADLRYKLVMASASTDIDTVSAADAVNGGALLMDWTANALTKAVTGLTAAHTYWFAVLVEDQNGNKALYAPASQTTPDAAAPVPGDAISFGAVTGTSIVVNWGAALDDVSAAANLKYKVVVAATEGAIDTLANADAIIAAPGLVMDWTANTTTKTATGLSAATAYAFAVLVKDEAGNKALYAPASTSTTETTAPVVGNTGVLDTAGIQGTTLWLRWTVATDNLTTKPNLSYKIVRSASNNLGDVAAAESNGTTVMDWTLGSDLTWQDNGSGERTAVQCTGLTATTSYYLNVIVRDQAGNKAVYTTKTATTTHDMSFTKVYANNQDGSTPSACPLDAVRAITAYKTSAYITQSTQHAGGCGNTSGDGQLGYIDISAGTPTAITWTMLSGANGVSYPGQIEVSGDGNTLFVGSDLGISSYDISTKSTPTYFAKAALSGVASMARWGDTMYLGRATAGLYGVSTHTLGGSLNATPQATWNGLTASSLVKGISVWDAGSLMQIFVGNFGTAGAHTGQGLYAVTIDKAAPTTISPVWSDTSSGFSFSGRSPDGANLWAFAAGTGRLTAFNTSTVTTTSALWGQANAGDAQGGQGSVLIDGRFAYVSNVDHGITVFDISQPGFSVPVYTRDTHADGDANSDAYGVQRRGEYLYVAAKSYFLTYKLVNVDALAPTPGNTGTIAPTPSSTQMALAWTAATDSATAPISATAQGSLEYRVYSGDSSLDFSTVRNVLEYGTAQGNWTAAMTSKTVTGLTPGQAYKFVVLVRDGWGNVGLYTARTASTISNQAPTATFAGGYLVSGAGTEAANGFYAEDGEQNGYPLYRKDGTYNISSDVGVGWSIYSGLTTPYTVMEETSTPPLDGWTVNQGVAPAPTLTAVTPGISGSPVVGQTLTVSYTYSDNENDPEGSTIIRWYRCGAAADLPAACTLALDTTKPNMTYVVVAADANNYIKVEVTPKASDGTATGAAVVSNPTEKVQ